MTTFDEREKAFEKKFAIDQELKFKSEVRCHRLLAEWAADKLCLAGTAREDYLKAMRKVDLENKDTDDVVRSVKSDFDAKELGIAETEIRSKMTEFLAQAVRDIEAAAKS